MTTKEEYEKALADIRAKRLQIEEMRKSLKTKWWQWGLSVLGSVFYLIAFIYTSDHLNEKYFHLKDVTWIDAGCFYFLLLFLRGSK